MLVTECGPVATTIIGLSKLSHQVINNKKLHKSSTIEFPVTIEGTKPN
jgi:hypothetical protein